MAVFSRFLMGREDKGSYNSSGPFQLREKHGFESWPHLTCQLCDLEPIPSPLWALVSSSLRVTIIVSALSGGYGVAAG